MSQFRTYRKKGVTELRPVTHGECRGYHTYGGLKVNNVEVSISKEDLKNGSPKKGDMIARNPKNRKDVWLVSEKYFNDNFELID